MPPRKSKSKAAPKKGKGKAKQEPVEDEKMKAAVVEDVTMNVDPIPEEPMKLEDEKMKVELPHPPPTAAMVVEDAAETVSDAVSSAVHATTAAVSTVADATMQFTETMTGIKAVDEKPVEEATSAKPDLAQTIVEKVEDVQEAIAEKAVDIQQAAKEFAGGLDDAREAAEAGPSEAGPSQPASNPEERAQKMAALRKRMVRHSSSFP